MMLLRHTADTPKVSCWYRPGSGHFRSSEQHSDQLTIEQAHKDDSFIHSFIHQGRGWPLAVFRHVFHPTASDEA